MGNAHADVEAGQIIHAAGGTTRRTASHPTPSVIAELAVAELARVQTEKPVAELARVQMEKPETDEEAKDGTQAERSEVWRLPLRNYETALTAPCFRELAEE